MPCEFNGTFDPSVEYTFGELLRPGMEITEQADADAYFEAIVKYMMERYEHSRSKAEANQRINLGYYAGYFDHDTRIRVERLFNCTHPLLGPASDGKLTAWEAFEMGKEWMKNKGGSDAL